MRLRRHAPATAPQLFPSPPAGEGGGPPPGEGDMTTTAHQRSRQIKNRHQTKKYQKTPAAPPQCRICNSLITHHNHASSSFTFFRFFKCFF